MSADITQEHPTTARVGFKVTQNLFAVDGDANFSISWNLCLAKCVGTCLFMANAAMA
jgi:hypothetical protein